MPRRKKGRRLDDIPIPGRDEERKLFNQVAAQFGEPAFARRARRVQEAFQHLLSRCRLHRDELLGMVRLRLGTLCALAGDWDALELLLADEQIDRLRRMYDELSPRLRMPVEPTGSARKLRRALEELAESVAHFNRRWRTYLEAVDLGPV